jgi:hypothetical protein
VYMGRDGTSVCIGGMGAGGGSGENLQYGVDISYNLIIRCQPVSYNLNRKVDHEKEAAV